MDEELIRQLRDHLARGPLRRFLAERANGRRQISLGPTLQVLLDQWDAALSNVIQLAPQKGVYSPDFEAELDRLYDEYVAPPRPQMRFGFPGKCGVRRGCGTSWNGQFASGTLRSPATRCALITAID
jgi:hypothetical protein